MLAAFRNRCISSTIQQWKLGFPRRLCNLKSEISEVEDVGGVGDRGLLNLAEVEKILSDVKADDVKVIPVCNTSVTDHVVIATGRSAWHVRNIAQALLYKAKQKQKQIGAKRMLLPSVEGETGGKWIVVDSGSLIIHALDEKMRAYYNLEALWTEEKSTPEESQMNCILSFPLLSNWVGSKFLEIKQLHFLSNLIWYHIGQKTTFFRMWRTPL